jgi:hypothetical protein
LLDVDGVLNAPTPAWPGGVVDGHADVLGRTYRLRWARDLVRKVAALHASGWVEVRWATTWVDHIEQIERLMHLPGMTTAFSGVDPNSLDARQLKIDAAMRVVEQERRPLIWTDDDAVPLEGPLLDRLDASGMPVLLVRPHLRHGLHPEDLAAIDDFIADVTALAG